MVNTYSYTPFGVITHQAEQVAQPFTYAGQYGVMSEPGGLYYMRARYYDADTGRFISEDPSGFDGGINLYAYCNSNPVNFIDPLGLCIEEPSAAIPFWEDPITIGIMGPAIAGRAIFAGLTAGENTVFFTGIGARVLAAASSGIPIFKTAIGSRMNAFEEWSGINLPRIVWDAASAVYAAGARGVAQVYISFPNSGNSGTFYRIEARIVEALGKAELNWNL